MRDRTSRSERGMTLVMVALFIVVIEQVSYRATVSCLGGNGLRSFLADVIGSHSSKVQSAATAPAAKRIMFPRLWDREGVAAVRSMGSITSPIGLVRA